MKPKTQENDEKKKTHKRIERGDIKTLKNFILRDSYKEMENLKVKEMRNDD